MDKKAPRLTMLRMPTYLAVLLQKDIEGVKYISATSIANILDLNHVQVRKDLSYASTAGRPKLGYETKTLIKDLQQFLGYSTIKEAIVVGAGSLGKALAGYAGFKNYGLHIIAAFDSNEELDGTVINNTPVYHISKLPSFAQQINIHIAIITTPASAAQEVCDLLVENGITAIWNFAFASLKAPDNVVIQNEDMATSLAMLTSKMEMMSGDN